MKIVITTGKNDWEGLSDVRFGRAQGFLVYDENTETVSWYSNEENMNANHGAGIQASQKVIELGADVVLTGNLGPKAKSMLEKTNTSVYAVSENTTNRQAYELFKNGELQKIL